MSRDWQPGDVAMVEAFWRYYTCQSEGAVRREGGWVSLLDGSYKPDGGEVQSARPLLVIDPEDREQVKRLSAAITDAEMFTGNDFFEHDAEPLQHALRALANPAPEVPDEPTDPAVRVVDSDRNEWARVVDLWTMGDGLWEWSDVLGHGPLRIVTPDAPTPDADRPLRVGDLQYLYPVGMRVRVHESHKDRNDQRYISHTFSTGRVVSNDHVSESVGRDERVVRGDTLPTTFRVVNVWNLLEEPTPC